MTEIPLMPFYRGLSALVDDGDVEMLSQFRWEVQIGNRGKLYVITRKWDGSERRYYRTRMHRMLLGVTSGEVDHRDGNGLNNQRENLRPATHVQNCANLNMRKIATRSGLKGVYAVTYKGVANKPWRAAISRDGIEYNLGSFDDKQAAAIAYDAAATRLFGEFARTNKMLGLI